MSLKVLKANQQDAALIADIHVKGWEEAYKTLLNHPEFNAPDVEKRTSQWEGWLSENSVLLAYSGDQAVGFVSFGRLKTPPPGSSPIRPLYSSEIYGLYVLPEFFKQGIGRALMSEAAKALIEDKHQSLCLWCIEKNKPALEFYKVLGGERCGKKNITLGPHNVRDVCVGWRDIKKLIA